MTPRRHAVPMPPQIARLPRDPRGYPIPYVASRWAAPMIPPPYTHRYGLVDAPDPTRGKFLDMGHMDGQRNRRCWIEGKCQVCARRIKGDRYLAGGLYDEPLDRFAFREPPTCGDCMVYAIQVCPGLVAGAMADPSGLRVVRAWDPTSIELHQERLMVDGKPHMVPDDPNLPESIKRGSVLVYMRGVVHDGEVFTIPQFLGKDLNPAAG